MLITMFTDISVDAVRKIGVYAIWAKEGPKTKTLRASGRFKEPVSDSGYAEVAAIVNGIFLVLKHYEPKAGSKIIAQTDSATAMALLEGKMRPGAAFVAQTRRLIERRDAILKDRGIQMDYRHVEGHKGHVTPRNAVNTWCDRECRRLLKLYRKGAKDEV